MLNNITSFYKRSYTVHTNSIHEKAFREMIIHQYGNYVLDELFEKIYLCDIMWGAEFENEI